MITIIFICLVFALIHSITVAQWFKRLCVRFLGETFLRVWYRFLYTVVSALTGAAAIYLIVQVPDRVLWEVPFWLRWLLHGVQVAGFLFGARAFQYLDTWEFMGIRQVWRFFSRKEVSGNLEGMTDRELVTTGVYGIVRHPLYVAGLIIFTFSPVITVNGLTITVLADLYFLFGMFIEERRFLRVYGDRYREYMQQVPRMLPWRTLRSRPLVLGALALCCIAALLVWFLGRSPDGEREGDVGQDVLQSGIAQDRAILSAAVQQRFPAWVEAWKRNDPRFEPRQMRHELTERIDASLIEPGASAPAGDIAGERLLRSPDGSKYLYLADGAEGEPDTELTLIDSERKVRRRLFFYGPATRVDGMQWLDNEVLVVVGADDLKEDDGPRTDARPQPVVWIFRLKDDLMSTYTWITNARPDAGGPSAD